MNMVPNNLFKDNYLSITMQANSLFGAIIQILKGVKLETYTFLRDLIIRFLKMFMKMTNFELFFFFSLRSMRFKS